VFIGWRPSSNDASYNNKAGFTDITDVGEFTVSSNGWYAACAVDGAGNFAFKLIQITNIMTGGGGTATTVTAVTVSPDPAYVRKGTTQQFTATVSGTNSPAQTVTWSIDETVVAGTSISNTGLLTVASDETAQTLTIRATSTADTTKSGTAKVTVEDIPIEVSAPPAIDSIIEGDTVISGTGVPGSSIKVTLPNGSRADTTVDSNGAWQVDVPGGIVLFAGQTVSANQTEIGKTVSDDAQEIVSGNTTVEPGIDIYVENLTTGSRYAQAGDILLYDVIVSNNGTASSEWQSAYVTFELNQSITLQVLSIRINNRTVAPSQYNYDSAANTLTLYLGDIVGGSGVSMSFRAMVSSDISNVDSVINAILGSLV